MINEFTSSQLSESKVSTDAYEPLHLWNREIEQVTSVGKTKDLEPVYTLLVQKLDTVCYQNQLNSDLRILNQ